MLSVLLVVRSIIGVGLDELSERSLSELGDRIPFVFGQLAEYRKAKRGSRIDEFRLSSPRHRHAMIDGHSHPDGLDVLAVCVRDFDDRFREFG